LKSIGQKRHGRRRRRPLDERLLFAAALQMDLNEQILRGKTGLTAHETKIEIMLAI
jgi:hypothetical protein